MHSRGSYGETRALSNEISRGLGCTALLTVIAFCIYNWVAGDLELGWLWIPFIFISVVLATLAVGLPILLFRVGLEFRRPTLGFGWFLALKIAATLWFFASFVVAWRVTGFVATLMR